MPGFQVAEAPSRPDKAEEGTRLDGAQTTRTTRLLHAAQRYAVALDEAAIDSDVQKVVRRLTRAGFEAYLVGGCVRDLLLGRKPKDFDVATSARPEEVRAQFRNSRIIGRRFRLVHVLFHAGKVIEVATFRRKPEVDVDEDNGEIAAPIRSDNVFGNAQEDSARRDFTVNALFYDLDRREILDWAGGLGDVERRVVNTIGDPVVRFREDPVRILRALKFAGRLDFGILPHVYDAIVHCRETLELAARARVAEEVLRLLRGGRARRTIYLAWETGVLELLLPELAAILYDSFHQDKPGAAHRAFRLLEFIDKATAEGRDLDDTVLWTLLLLEPLNEAADGAPDRGAAMSELLESMMMELAIPRRFADAMRRIVSALPRVLAGKVNRFARSEIFSATLDVAEAHLFARGRSVEPITRLRGTTSPEPDAGARRRRQPSAP
jgi:poly(A) polymerase